MSLKESQTLKCNSASHLNDELEGADGANDADQGVHNGDGDVEHPHPGARPLGRQV